MVASSVGPYKSEVWEKRQTDHSQRKNCGNPRNARAAEECGGTESTQEKTSPEDIKNHRKDQS